MHYMLGVFKNVVVTIVFLSVAVYDFLVRVAVKLLSPINVPINE